MGERNRYQRIFFIFSQEDSGFGMGQEPSGYAKIEVLDNRGKLAVFAQNLKEDAGKLEYRIYLIRCEDKQVYPAYVGVLPVKRNRGELLWEFNPTDVGKTGRKIEEFNAAVVLVEYKDRKNTTILCPLAGYKNGKVLWREKLKEVLYFTKKRESEAEEETPAVRQELTSNYTDDGFESVNTPLKEETAEAVPVQEIKEDKHPGFGKTAEELLNSTVEMEQPVPSSEPDNAGETAAPEEESRQDDSVDYPGIQAGENPAVGIPATGEFTDYREYEKYLEKNLSESAVTPVLQTGMQGMFPNGGAVDPSQANMAGPTCSDCQLDCTKRAVPPAPSGVSDLERFKKELDKYFELHSPFPTRRRDYKWWKVPSPVQLNNLLYMCNIKTPLLFNPKVMMAHFKYRYIIIGIYTDRVRRREYIVCGVPGVYGVDDRAFGDACRWVQVEGMRPKYGAFGYWLVYIDPKSGKLIGAN